jgi:hypothetical protein
MADIVAPGVAIEGEKLGGSSREPLNARGLVQHNQVRCYRFTAFRDVKAAIEQEIAPEQRILEPDALTNKDAELICQKVLVHSLDRTPSLAVRNRTATHKASFWDFRKRTAAKIDQAHEQMINALAKPKKLPGSK